MPSQFSYTGRRGTNSETHRTTSLAASIASGRAPTEHQRFVTSGVDLTATNSDAIWFGPSERHDMTVDDGHVSAG